MTKLAFKHNNKEATDINELPDGRVLFKTHNGFKFFVRSKKNEVTEVTEGYWITTKRNCTTKKSKRANQK